ncbi:hypothetical protein OPQ81_000722 [Rhizoctonia solani]|nr:hypothetical protein OPQ81_000722 [Rhizoctonia solani]
MIIDVEAPPKSPASSGPTVRQALGPSVGRAPVSYSTFPETRHSTQNEYDRGNLETTTLLYQTVPQSIYDDVEPPSYDEINATPKTSASRNRLWTRCVAIFLVIFLTLSVFYSYNLSKIRRPVQTPPNVPRESPFPPSPPSNPNIPYPTSSSPSPPAQSLPPLPPASPPADLPAAPFIPPIKGRTDLCRPWAYSLESGVRPSLSDNRPVDKLVYTIPTLAPIRLETSAVCLTPNGTSAFCEDYDDSYDSIAGKLQVVGADVDLPQIEVTIQHGSEAGLDDTAVCLMKKPDENGKDRWILGLYAWKGPITDDRDALLVSVSIIVTLPRSQVHNLSTHLNYFSQVIGPEAKTDLNTLTFDTLEARLGERGSLLVRNVTVATINSKAFGDAQQLMDTRVTKLAQIRSDYGLISCSVSLVQTKGNSPVRLDLQSEIGVVTSVINLEYPLTPSNPPRFDIKAFSRFSPAIVMVKDPRGMNLLRQNPGLIPDILPIIQVNATSHLSVGQAVIPATFQGDLALSSNHAGIVAIDHAKDLPGRTISWEEPTSRGYRGVVRWAGRHRKPEETGFVSATTGYASARLLFLGLDDDDITNWPEGEDAITLGRLE